MKASRKFVELSMSISRNIHNEGFCLLSERKIATLCGRAADFQLKLQRLRAFAQLHGWRLKSLDRGRAAMFYALSHPAHESDCGAFRWERDPEANDQISDLFRSRSQASQMQLS
jgi:hypothetical protein